MKLSVLRQLYLLTSLHATSLLQVSTRLLQFSNTLPKKLQEPQNRLLSATHRDILQPAKRQFIAR